MQQAATAPMDYPPLPSIRENISISSQSGDPTIAILLCTYNGEAYLRSQIESYLSQTYQHWRLYVSDDGSTDGTMTILQEYLTSLGSRMILLNGPKKGFAQNFMSLIRNEEIHYDFYAFSDQDDIWLPEKLARSLAAVAGHEKTKPFLYCSRTRLIDQHGNVLGLTPLFEKLPGFRNALVQSIAGANTMLINETTRRLLARTDQHAAIVAHDWLAYLIVSGCGGTVVYDPEPTLLYRQHGANLIGANTGARNRMRGIREMMAGRFKNWNDKNSLILKTYVSFLTSENRVVLEKFNTLRKSRLLRRILFLREIRLYRQTRAGTVSLYAAIVANKI
jgi:glycosyltransferase involved in cell wall biosynthesis